MAAPIITPVAGRAGAAASKQRQALVKGLKKNVMSTVSLTDMLAKSIKVQDSLQSVLISTGNRQALEIGKLGGIMNNVGLSMSESIGMFNTMSNNSLKITDQNTRDTLARSIKLGKDFQTTAKIMAMNTQALGISSFESNKMADAFIKAGGQFGINSDLIVQAIHSLSKTLIQSAAVYGPQTALALEKATTELLGKYGAGNAEMIKEMATALFGGTEKSTKMAAMLGLPLDRLATTDPDEMVSMFNQALESLQQKAGAGVGTGTAGFTIPRILQAFGATPAMLQLATLTPMTAKQAILNAEQLEALHMSNNLSRSIESLLKDLTVIMLPIVQVLGKVATFFSKIFSFINDFGGALIPAIMAFSGVAGVLFKFKGLTGGPLALATGVIGAIGLGLNYLVDWGEDEKEDRKKLVEEAEKQTAALYDSGQARVLGEIANRLSQANIYSEQLVINAEEHLQETKDSRTDKINASPENTNAFAIQ